MAAWHGVVQEVAREAAVVMRRQGLFLELELGMANWKCLPCKRVRSSQIENVYSGLQLTLIAYDTGRCGAHRIREMCLVRCLVWVDQGSGFNVLRYIGYWREKVWKGSLSSVRLSQKRVR